MSRARDLDGLAAKLRRPAKSLEEFARLAPEEIEILSDAIDATFERESQRVDHALDRAMPQFLRPIARRILGSRRP